MAAPPRKPLLVEAVGIPLEETDEIIEDIDPPNKLQSDRSPKVCPCNWLGFNSSEKTKGQTSPSLDYPKLIKPFPKYFSRKKSSNGKAEAAMSNPDFLELCSTRAQILPFKNKAVHPSPQKVHYPLS